MLFRGQRSVLDPCFSVANPAGFFRALRPGLPWRAMIRAPAGIAATVRRAMETHETAIRVRSNPHRRPDTIAATDVQKRRRTVAVYATVAEKDGRLITDLARDAFEIRDNGKAATDYRLLHRGAAGKCRDHAGPQRQHARQCRTGRTGRRSVHHEPRPRRYRAHRHLRRTHRHAARNFTSDKGTLLRILRSGQPVTGPTPLWNAHRRGGRRRCADGKDARSCSSSATAATRRSNLSPNNRSIMDVMRSAQQDDVMVYAIGLQTTVLRGPSPRGGIGGSMPAVDDVGEARSGSRDDRRRHRRRLLRAQPQRRSRRRLSRPSPTNCTVSMRSASSRRGSTTRCTSWTCG